jgi:DNA-binding MarR family transcriptional regulator
MWRYKKAGDSLSPGRLRALVVLMRAGEATHGELARAAELNPATVTAMLEQLELQGVVSRRPHETDGRVWWVSLTAKGKREVARLQAVWDEYFAEAFADTPDADLDIACDVLEKVVLLFESIGSDS